MPNPRANRQNIIATGLHPDVQAWMLNVTEAGGSTSQLQAAVNDFVENCDRAGIWGGAVQVLMLATDGFNGLFVPVVNRYGNVIVNNGYAAGDYAVATGLQGATAKYIDSGWTTNKAFYNGLTAEPGTHFTVAAYVTGVSTANGGQGIAGFISSTTNPLMQLAFEVGGSNDGMTGYSGTTSDRAAASQIDPWDGFVALSTQPNDATTRFYSVSTGSDTQNTTTRSNWSTSGTNLWYMTRNDQRSGQPNLTFKGQGLFFGLFVGLTDAQMLLLRQYVKTFVAARTALLDPLTQSFVTRAVAAGANQSNIKIIATDIFIKELRSKGLLSVLHYILLYPASGGFTGCNVPLIDLYSLGNSTLNNFVSGDWSASGLFGGNTKYISSPYNPVTQSLSVSSAHYWDWKITVDLSNTYNDAEGCQDDGLGYQFQIDVNGSLQPSGRIGAQSAGQAVTHTPGWYIVNQPGSQLELYRDTTQLATAGAGSGSMPNGNMAFMALQHVNSSYIYNYGVYRSMGHGIGSGLTSTQRTDLYNALAAFKTNVGA